MQNKFRTIIYGLLITFLGVVNNPYIFAQSYKGGLRVYTIDAFSGSAVPDVNIQIVGKSDTLKKSVNSVGYLYLDSVPVGYYNVLCSHVAYETFVVSNIEILSGKSKELRISLVPQSIKIPEFTVVAPKDAFKPSNELITLAPIILIFPNPAECLEQLAILPE